jgi:hypothetical protein
MEGESENTSAPIVEEIPPATIDSDTAVATVATVPATADAEADAEAADPAATAAADDIDSDDSDDKPAAPKRKIVEESDDSSVGENQAPRKPTKKKARLNKSMFDDEAVLSGSDDSEDEVEEDQNEYVQDDFVVLDGDGDIAKSERKKKEYSRLRKNRGDMLLVEDDIALMHENNAAAASRDRTPIKKVKKAYDNSIGPERVGRSEALTSDNEASGSEEENDEDVDEMDDFLVDDLEDGSDAETGGERRARAPRRQQASYQDGPGQEEINEAFDIFGEGYDDYMDNDEAEEEEESEEDDDDDDNLFSEKAERREDRRAAKKSRKAALKVQRGKEGAGAVRSMFERSKLIETFCTEHDDVLRNEDLPERFIGVMAGRTPPDLLERREEANWIAQLLADKIVDQYGSFSNFPRHFDIYGSHHELEDSLVSPVDFVLSMLQVDKYEVPFIWTYRKDYLHSMMTRQHLWWINAMDAKWENLIGRRNDLLSELALVASVAEGSLREDTAEQLTSQLNTLRTELVPLQAAKAEAHGVYEIALDATDGDDVSANDRAKVGAMLCYAMLCYAMLCYVCYAML